MANELITASVVISFTESSRGILTAEVDDRPLSEGGFNSGDTTFYPGASPAFLRYKTANVAVSLQQASEGALVALGTVLVKKTETLQFQNKKTVNLQYPYYSGFAVNKRSNPGLVLSVDSGSSTVSLANPAVAVAEVSYLAQAQGFRIVGASGQLPVLVYIEGTAT